MNVVTGETWELSNKTLMGGWVCRHAGPTCSNHNCPSNVFKEFSEAEIHEHVIIDPAFHIGKWLGQLELGLVAELNQRLRHLTGEQQRSLLLAIRGHIDKQLSLIKIEEP